ncbi:rRNA maturation RNase YbeY [Candidatus Termititenax persephonae]|uniref:Endoribonuclease YbeY n=1 Tax=Candidatus Termititenax persephonae TaxID=2218525 RepID=A0A388TFU9_9BACT|nr:rRNA maturation RNase YbeY [Candidatus Termititenax persephonae]
MYYFNTAVKTKINRAAATAILRRAGLQDISVTFCSQQLIRELNKKFRGQNKPTDVLSFATGDIVICPALAAVNARRYGNSLAAELLYLLVHAACHLCGHDHAGARAAARMHVAENRLLTYVRQKYKITVTGRI